MFLFSSSSVSFSGKQIGAYCLAHGLFNINDGLEISVDLLRRLLPAPGKLSRTLLIYLGIAFFWGEWGIILGYMEIRNAMIKDVKRIHELINSYAEVDKMLYASVSAVYERLLTFTVAEEGGSVIGCCAMQVLWENLAEIKSLAVDEACFGKGVGRALVQGCLDKARGLGLKKVFTLTMEPGFFEKIGFVRVDRETLPMKVWSDCANCPKQDHCDEIALEATL